MKTSKSQTTNKQKKTSDTGKSVSSKATAIKTGPGEEEIRNKAREIYNERLIRGEQGTSEGDWIKAEELLRGSKR